MTESALDRPGCLVSVIVPAFNGGRYIRQTLESALAEAASLPGTEVIVVDDGSADDTVEVVRSFRESVRLIVSGKNGGVAAARNLGIRAAAGKYVALLDQDDLFLPGKLRRQVAELEANPRAVLCHANILMIDECGKPVPAAHLGHQPGHGPPSGSVLARLFEWNFVLACTVLMRRDAVIALGGFNGRLWGTDDYELWLRLATRGEFIYVDEILARYRWHASNASRNTVRMTVNRLAARDEFVRSTPSAWTMLGAPVIRRRFGDYAADYAYHLYKNAEQRAARELLRIALRYAPFDMRIWRRYVASWFN